MELTELIRQLTQAHQILEVSGRTHVNVYYEKVLIKHVTVENNTGNLQIVLKG